MDVRWMKGHKDLDARKKKLASYEKAFTELALILEGMKSKPLKSDYDCPAWPYKRADMDGHNRALTQVLSLINLKDK